VPALKFTAYLPDHAPNPVAKLSSAERELIAETRLLRILRVAIIANQRTLEQKISDAGPYTQRINPHVLTEVRQRLVLEGLISVANHAGAPWFYASNTSPAEIEARLQQLLPVYKSYLALGERIGQTLEIATYRALATLPNADFSGRFKNLDEHDDSQLYKKEEPQQHIGIKSLAGGERLDFILRTNNAGPLGIECKNVRHWLYPHVPEIEELLRKCIALDIVPVLIARRIPFVTFTVLSKCGLIIHQTYNQLFPASETALGSQVRDKTLLGYHDVRLGNQPDARLLKFITTNLPLVAARAREKFDEHKDLLEPFSSNSMTYEEFAARVLRRDRGEDESGEFPSVDW
jgi:hypothetical protein